MKVKTHPQTWGNVPPYKPTTLWRAFCPSCGWTGQWWSYKENADREGTQHECEGKS